MKLGLSLFASVFSLGLLCAPLAAQWESGRGEVPYVPTPPEVVEGMLKLAEVKEGDTVIDLGCGDGRIAVMAAEKFHARSRGVDINPERIQEAEENAKKAGVTDRVRFIESNLFDADVREATVVTLYLLPDVNRRLRPKLLKDLKTGSRIVSHAFDMGDWQPDKKISVNNRSIYLWHVTEAAKAKYGPPPDQVAADGEWIFTMPTPNGEIQAQLTLKTDGKKLSGTFLFPENRRLEISDGTINGNQMNFTVRRDRQQGGFMVYKMTGTIDGGQVKGKTETEMDGRPITQEWSAKRK